MVYQSINDFVKSKRIEKNKTQADVSKALGLDTTQFVSNIERGLTNIPTSRYKQLAEFLGFDVNKLIEMNVQEYRRALAVEVKDSKKGKPRK